MSSPFELVTQNLRRLGAIPVSEYLALTRPAEVHETQATQPSLGLLEMDADEDREEFNNEQSAKAMKTGFAVDEGVLAIERACEGRCAHSGWVYYCPLDSDAAVQWGAAFRVDLPFPQFYATDQIYATQEEAKSACAQTAILEGVLKAINALQPSSQNPHVAQESFSEMSLSMWFDKLPRPLTSFFDDKVLTEIHGAVTLDSWAGKARGARFKMHYYFPTFGQHPHRCRYRPFFRVYFISKRLVYGCVLRIQRPKECRSFFVDPVFSKRFDAKTAVCLLAISLGIEEYYSSVANEFANIIPPGLRAFANEQILPLLNQMAHGDTRHYSYPMDRNAFGCTLTVGVGSDEIQYSTEPEFSSKADAKVAVLLIAATNGLIEFINYGHTPSDFQAHLAAIEAQVLSMPITFTTPTKRNRDPSMPQPIPVMKESKKLKSKRKQAQAAAMKGEAAAFLIKDGTSRTSQSSSRLRSEKSLTMKSVPLSSGSLPFAPADSQLVQVPLVQEQVGTWPTSMWGNPSLNPSHMPRQPYMHHHSPYPAQNQYRCSARYMDPSSQQFQYGYDNAGPC
ncbi:hypothetical protein C0992_007584 [Termitomyces sp. T32_za158]|nr:hypothetical protein C0992_007584 [Termitomyces sp. T32_za158]